MLKLILFLFVTSLFAREQPVGNLPPVIDYHFKGESEKMIKGESTLKDRSNTCKGTFPDSEIIDGLSIAAGFYQNGCYTNGVYNYTNWKVESGILNGNNRNYKTFYIHPPAGKPEKFLSSHHYLVYRSPDSKPFSIYAGSSGSFKKVYDSAAPAQENSNFFITNIDLSILSSPQLFVIVPRGEQLSELHTLAENTSGAMLKRTKTGNTGKIRIQVKGRVFDTDHEFLAGPSEHGNTYGINRQMFFLKTGIKKHILYQDKSNGDMNLLSLTNDFYYHKEITLTKTSSEILLAASSDEKEHIYIFSSQTGKATSEGSIQVKLRKFHINGKLILEQSYDTSRKGFNIHHIADSIVKCSSVASMSYHKERLLLILSRTMHKSGDGVNHQGAIGVVIHPQTLEVIKNTGQTSGHSFGNFITNIEDGFIAIDLGDNYPRGIHLHKFQDTLRTSRVVYTMKTRHGTKDRNSSGKVFPAYTEISTPGKQFYKWSNDNRTYTEIGGAVETKDGYIVVFASEFPSLDNASTDENLNQPRNLAFVHVRKNFHTVKGYGNVVPDEVMVHPQNPEEGMFYNYGGGESKQRNTGIIKLTNYKDSSINVSRPRIIPLGDDVFFIYYEEWSPKHYKTSKSLIINAEGKILSGIEDGSLFRINRQDDLYIDHNAVFILAGRAEEKAVEINFLRLP